MKRHSTFIPLFLVLPPEIIRPPERTEVRKGDNAVFYCFALSHGGLENKDWQ